MKVALAVGGSDSGGGAGIQADLATFRALGVWGTTAITCITAQSPHRVHRVEPVSPHMVAEQIAVVCCCVPVAAVKIGMTWSPPIIEAVAAAVAEHAGGAPVVLDPVMRASSGAPLLQGGGEAALVQHLLPLADVVTPNLAEAQALSGIARIDSVAAMEEAARRIARLARGTVVVKGGHLGDSATDVVLHRGAVTRLEAERLAATHSHGTGCSFASAMAAGLAHGLEVVAAARQAKAYVALLIKNSVELSEDGLGGLGHVTENGTWHPR